MPPSSELTSYFLCDVQQSHVQQKIQKAESSLYPASLRE